MFKDILKLLAQIARMFRVNRKGLLLIGVAVLLAGFVELVFHPMVNGFTVCFEQNTAAINHGLEKRSQESWDRKEICLYGAKRTEELEVCLDRVKQRNAPFQIVGDVIVAISGADKKLAEVKQQHYLACSNLLGWKSVGIKKRNQGGPLRDLIYSHNGRE